MARDLNNNANTGNEYLDQNRGELFLGNGELYLARNATYYTDRGDIGYISTEPSNELCVKIEYKDCAGNLIPGNVNIIGATWLYDEWWAIFSTQNNMPTNNQLNEIGLFDYKRCEYIPVVRSKCLRFSPLYPIRSVVRFSEKDMSYVIYFSDGFNPDRVINLGPVKLWYTDKVSRGCVDTVPWGNGYYTIPYLSYDNNPGTDCFERSFCQPLVLDCERLRLALTFKSPIVTCKKSVSGGTLPNGLYYVAIAYSVNGDRYSNYFVSQLAHLWSPNNNNALTISLDGLDDTFFREIEVVIISQVKGATEAVILGHYNINTKNLEVGFISPNLPRVDPSFVFRNIPVYESSNGVFSIGPYLVRTGPKGHFNFNYQPLANLIRVEWVSAEYPADYYEKTTKNPATNIYTLESDVVGFMRDEIYTFYIRWVYDTGDRSPLFHIPAPPLRAQEECDVCGNDDKINKWKSINNSVHTDFANTQDGGIRIAYGVPGTFFSDEKYDCNHPERWNFSHFHANVLIKNPSYIVMPPYAGTNLFQDYDLCCQKIRLVHMPSETLANELKLYNDTNNTIRYLGVRFSNINHPVDNEGQPIQNIIGFEILRAAREGNKTIIAKGIIEKTLEYNYLDPKKSGTSDNALFANYPFDPDYQFPNPVNPFLTTSRVSTLYGFNQSKFEFESKILTIQSCNADDSYKKGADATNNLPLYVPKTSKDAYVFRSPDINFGRPYVNWDKLHIYGEYYGNSKTIYFIPKKFPRYKLLSPFGYGIVGIRSLFEAGRILNGRYRIEYPQLVIDAKSLLAAGSDMLGIIGVVDAIFFVLQLLSTVLGMQVATNLISLGSNFPSAMFGYNLIGLTPGEYVSLVNQSFFNIQKMMAILGGGELRTPRITKVEDGLLEAIPRDYRLTMYIPMFLSALSGSFKDLEVILKSSLPFHDYVLQIASHGFYDKFASYGYCDKIVKLKDSVYIGSHIFNYGDKHINNLYRTRYLLLKFKNPVCEIVKTKKDYSIDVRLFCNCCCVTNCNNKPNNTEYDVVAGCQVQKDISAAYGSLKVLNNRPYGQLFETKNILMSPVISVCQQDGCAPHDQGCRCDEKKVNKCRLNFNVTMYKTPDLFYGDTYVTRYSEKDTFLYFYDWPNINSPDGFDFEFLKRRNILYPRYWINTQPIDLNDYINTQLNNCEACFNPTILNQAQSPWCSLATCTSIDNFMQDVLGTGSINKCKGLIDSIKNNSEWLCAIENALFNPIQKALLGIAAAFGVIQNLSDSCGDGFGGLLCKIGVMLLALIMSIALLVIVINLMVFQILLVILSGIVSLVGAVVVFPLLSLLSICIQYNLGTSKILGQLLIPYNLDGCLSKRCTNSSGNKISFRGFGYFGMWMYLSHSTVRDFYVESDYNMAFREEGNEPYTKYFNIFRNNNLIAHFDIDNIKAGDSFIYDDTMRASRSYLSYASHGFMQPRDYNPIIEERVLTQFDNVLIYSLPYDSVSGIDGNRIFLPNNWKVMADAITGLKQLGDSGALVIYQHSRPEFFLGVDNLTTNADININLGSGKLFEQPARASSNADLNYQFGSCQDVNSIINSPYGIFYVSGTTGKIFRYTGGIEEISFRDLGAWSNSYMRYRITDDFPDFELLNNTLDGIGMFTIFDGKKNIVYFCKRDYVLREDIRDKVKNGQISIEFDMEYTDPFGIKQYKVFVIRDANNNVIDVVNFKDPIFSKYFDDVSVTLSYSPLLNKFISFHDWHPDIGYGTHYGFFTINDDSIWKHNIRHDSYCNYYGVNYPFEIDIINTTGVNVTSLRSLELYLEARLHKENGVDYFHDLYYFFDRLIVYNSEQCSGRLDLVLYPHNNPIASLNYPFVTPAPSIQVLYEKVEQKYRVNDIYDIVKDRGQFTNATDIFIKTDINGYIRSLDNTSLDYNKPVTQKKRFRHYSNHIWLIKEADDVNKGITREMVFKMLNTKISVSFR